MSAVLTSMTKITTPSENWSTWHTLSPIHILHSTVNVGSTNTFCRQKLDYCALSLFGGIHGTIVKRYLASASVNNTLPLSSVYQISPDIHCHLPGKSQSSTAGNNGAPTSVPLSLGHALYYGERLLLCLSSSMDRCLRCAVHARLIGIFVGVRCVCRPSASAGWGHSMARWLFRRHCT